MSMSLCKVVSLACLRSDSGLMEGSEPWVEGRVLRDYTRMQKHVVVGIADYGTISRDCDCATFCCSILLSEIN